MNDRFKAMMLKQVNGEAVAEISQLSVQELPEHQILVRVHYSSLNYKDALAITGKGKIIKSY